ncbi:MAG: dTDP-4-dehydrorhamnose reductase [Oscillatoriophycideae cyanobacterium NC_groundwater_1537_Pr4_S-0.65um_50_18]|nr:dTDP-4-dehydrorhamnose reductase [Oscillatoriophycideae cyanobacterium NC_groundwater_1537_Pr4_S-0.65um_50_18]
MSRILLIGSAGQVGQELQTTLKPLGDLISVAREHLDLTQPDRIRQVIQSAQPNLIVNAAAYTAVDKAETEMDLAKAINAEAPTVMAEVCQQMGASLIHISTDYVFDGSKNTPYTETDTPNPIGAYGQSKLLGEEGIRQVGDRSPDFHYAILRTAWVYGAQGKGNFVKTMLRVGADRPEIRVVADQVGTPTWSTEIARAIAKLSPHFLAASEAPSGIYHFTNNGITSWYDFAVAIFEEAEALGFPLKLEQVVPITTAEYPTPTRRPAYSALACQKISAILQTPTPQWRQSLRHMLTELYSLTHS